MDDNEVDRISNLPESLTHHILSFLDMKYVVQTSVLSRGWRYVWKTVSTLIFRLNEHEHDHPGYIEIDKFPRFVDKVLLLRGVSDIQKFHLHLDLYDTYIKEDLFDTYTLKELLEDHIYTWILVALSRNVQDLLIHIDIAEGDGHVIQIRFPHCLFNSKSLKKLVLYMTGIDYSRVFLPSSTDLPRLEFLELSAFHTEDVVLVNKLISSCPVLESLVLRDIWIENGDDMNVYVSIKSHVLKHLEIINDSDFRGDPCYSLSKIIKLSTPNLVSFFCGAQMASEYYCLENLSSLVTATIDIIKERSLMRRRRLKVGELSEKQKKEGYPKRMMEFLSGFHNVKKLKVLAPDFIQVLGRYPDLIEFQSSPQFHNLRRLKLGTFFTRGCLRAMIYLLKTSPSIEYLFLTTYKPVLSFPDIEDVGELSLPCLMSHLKHIEIRNIYCSEIGLNFLEFLLKNAIVLEKMVMSFYTGGFLYTTDRVMSLPRRGGCPSGSAADRVMSLPIGLMSNWLSS